MNTVPYWKLKSMGNYLIDQLEVVGLKRFEKIDFICGNICATNKKLATEIFQRILKDAIIRGISSLLDEIHTGLI